MSIFRRNRGPESTSSPESPSNPAGPNAMEALMAEAQAERAREDAERIAHADQLRAIVRGLPNPRVLYRKEIDSMLDPNNFRAEPTPEMEIAAKNLVMQRLHEQSATLLKGSESNKGSVHCSNCAAVPNDNVYTVVRFSSPDAYTLDETQPYDKSRQVSLGTFSGSVELREGFTKETDVQRLQVSELNFHEIAQHPELNPDLMEQIDQILRSEQSPDSAAETPPES